MYRSKHYRNSTAGNTKKAIQNDMYKKYYKTIFKDIFIYATIAQLYLVVYMGVHIHEYTNPLYRTIIAIICSIISLVALIVICIAKCNYLIIENEQLTMKNVLWPFRDASFKYENIKYIEFSNSLQPYFKIFTQTGKPKFYILGCVRGEDFIEIVETLQKKGVKLEIGDHVKKTYLHKKR